jgi:exopolysaccharide biosynthesis polyprenyl glycosylphosphotransferase
VNPVQPSSTKPKPLHSNPVTAENGPDAEVRQAPFSKSFRWQPTTEFVLAMAMLGDALVIFAGLRLGFWARFDSGLIPLRAEAALRPKFFDYFYLLVMGTAFLLATFGYLHLYSLRSFRRYLRTARVIVQGTIFWLFAYLAVSLILKFDPPISRLFMVSSFICVLGGMLGWRFFFSKIIRWEFFAINLRQRVLFVGWGKEADQLETEIRADYNHPYEIIGCLPPPHGVLQRPPPASVRLLGTYQTLGSVLEQRQADIVILADLSMKADDIISLVNLCEMEFARFKVIPSYFQVFASGLRLETISGVPVLGVSELPLDHFSNRLIKRVVDLAGGVVGLLISIPVIAIFGALVYLEAPGPIFYLQDRTGKNGRSFQIIKIRSMRLDAEAKGAQWAEENDPRRLRIGAFMRRWNIDEVPQFWNVLKGDMSLVGPRPERPELISHFKHQIPHYHARHSCLPGMTGWAQINGWRGNTSLEERIRHDIWYVENWGLGLDFRIMFLTLPRQKNAY